MTFHINGVGMIFGGQGLLLSSGCNDGIAAEDSGVNQADIHVFGNFTGEIRPGARASSPAALHLATAVRRAAQEELARAAHRRCTVVV